MRYLNNIAAIIEAISQQWVHIQDQIGDEWPTWETQLLNSLRDLADATDEAQAVERITDLFDLGLQTPAAPLFRQILRDHPLDGGLQDASRLGNHWKTTRTKVLESVTAEEVVTLASLQTGIAKTITQLTESAADTAAPRYLNAGFFTAAGQIVPPDQPLALDTAPYQLAVNIGAFWGPGTAVAPFPNLPDDLYDENDDLTLTVIARTQNTDLQIGTPQQTLTLPKAGDSPTVLFDLVMGQPGRFNIDVGVFYHGHLLQSRRTEFKVVQNASEELPASAWPVQDGYITFTRTAHLTRAALAPLAAAPRRLTILAERDAHSQTIAISVYDNSGEGLQLRPSTLTDANLTPLLNGLRRRLLATMDAYSGVIGGSEATLASQLGQLADAGYAFYRALLPGLSGGPTNPEQTPSNPLRPGDVIQIAPLSAQVSVPWELVYERPIHSQRHTLCPTFRTHGPETTDCPHRNDPHVVCPHGFWGYRYVIEQLPCRIERHAPLPNTALPLLVPNGRPLHLTAVTYNTSPSFTRHWQHLRHLGSETELHLEQITHWDGAEQFFTNQETAVNLLYFYTHGGKTDIGQPFLQLADDSKITLNDLDAWRVHWPRQQPLVILNACESANYTPDDYESLMLFFSQQGAAGIIGAQCPVKELLADAFIIPFLTQFLRQMPVGAALFAARRQLLYDHLDPRGLAYSLFAAAEIQLAQPALAEKTT